MQLRKTLDDVAGMLRNLNVPFALIGAMALSEHNHARATQDIDFMIPEESVATVMAGMAALGYTVFFQSENVLQLQGPGSVDFLIARRPISRAMLANAKAGPKTHVPCVSAEDIIGLKMQAYKNDPKRELQDKADIQALIEKNGLDWDKVKYYADHFQEWPFIEDLRKRVGK